MSVNNDNEKAIGLLGRQEILTGLIVAVLAMIPIGAIALIVIGLSNPEIVSKIDVTGNIDFGRFLDKVIESYDAFLLLLGVGIGTSGTVAAVKLGKSLAK